MDEIAITEPALDLPLTRIARELLAEVLADPDALPDHIAQRRVDVVEAHLLETAHIGDPTP